MRYIREISKRLSTVFVVGAAIGILLVPVQVFGQSLAVGGRVSTLGLGVEGSVTFLDRVGARIGVNAFALSVEGEADDIDYDFDVDLLTATFLADLYLTKNGLRISAGLVSNENKFDLVAQIQDEVEIGDSTYSDADVGNLFGRVRFDDVRPFLGIGIDSSLNKGGGLGFIVEVGALFQGSPSVFLEADGLISTDEQFKSDLAREQEELSDDLSSFKVYPVVALGLSYHL